MNDRRLSEVEESLPTPGDDFGARVVRWANLPRSAERRRVVFFRLRHEVRRSRERLAAMSRYEREAHDARTAPGYREADAMTDAALFAMLDLALDA